MKWITRARPKTDRIACPWLIYDAPVVHGGPQVLAHDGSFLSVVRLGGRPARRGR